MRPTVVIGDDDALTRGVIAELRARGRPVTWWIPAEAVAPPSPPEGVTLARIDLGQRFALPRALDGAAALVHLRHAPWQPARARDAIYRINLEHTGHLLTAAREVGTPHVVWRASPFALGTDPGAPWDLGDVHLPWVQSQRLAYLEVVRQGGLGVPLCVAVPTLEIGPGATGPAAQLTDAARAGALAVASSVPVNVVDVRDVALALARLSDGEHQGTTLLPGGRASLTDLLAAAASAGGARRPAPIPPALLGAAARALGALGSRVTAGQLQLLSRPWAWGEGRWPDALGVQPRPWEEALRA